MYICIHIYIYIYIHLCIERAAPLDGGGARGWALERQARLRQGSGFLGMVSCYLRNGFVIF